MIRQKLFVVLALFITTPAAAFEPNTFIALISGFNQPYSIAITPSGLYAYIGETTGAGSSVRVIDTDSSSPTFNQIVAAPNLIGVFNQPFAIAITPNSNFAYVCNSGTNSVLVIDTSTNTLVAAPGLIGTFNQPGSIAITPNGLYAYVINVGNNDVNVIDLSNNTILATPNLVGVLNNPFDIAITPDGSYAYVSNLNNTSVTVIDISTNTVFATINSVPQPQGMSITPDGKYVYVSNGGGLSVTVIDTASNTIVSTPNLDTAFNFPNDVAILSNGSYAYVTNFLGTSGNVSAVSVIDTNPGSPTYNSTLFTPGLALPSIPTIRFFTLAATPNAQFVYAVDGFNNTVDVIYTGAVFAPLNVSGCKTSNGFLLQTDYINRLSWSAPAIGATPAAYKIYRAANMEQFVATVPGTVFTYTDHNRQPRTNDTYYIASVGDGGTISTLAATTVTQACSAR